MLVSKSHSLLFLLQLRKSTCPEHSSVHSRPHYRLCVCHTHGCMFVGSELNGEEQSWRKQAATTIARVSVLCSEMESSVYFTLGWMGLRSSPSPFLLHSYLISPALSFFFTSPFFFLSPGSQCGIGTSFVLSSPTLSPVWDFFPATFCFVQKAIVWLQLNAAVLYKWEGRRRAWTSCSMESSVITLIIVSQPLSLSCPQSLFCFFFLRPQQPILYYGFYFLLWFIHHEPIYFWSMSTFKLKFFEIFINFVVSDSLGISTSTVNFLKVIQEGAWVHNFTYSIICHQMYYLFFLVN